MALRSTCFGLMTLICLASGQAASVSAEETAEIAPPYLMIRSLQTIQDKVINGDLDSVDVQRYLLEEIDKRLRAIDMAVFDDPRNVDAALIYAMSGGNPETLDILAERDVEGNFDNRVTSILRRYLSGRGATALRELQEVVPEYRNSRIGPYLELIGANALMEKETATALKFFDWARAEAPGTIIEEAALRRSLGITSAKGDTARALPFARRYARRFMNSPYASQFADIFVSLAIDHKNALPPDEIKAVLSLIERKRQREIYLRLGRRAAIDGNKPLTDFASKEARRLSSAGDTGQLALAELYSGIVNIPSDGINQVLEKLAEIPDKSLSPKDRFLRDAARIVAEEVVKEPGEDSLRQVERVMVDKEYRDMMSERVVKASDEALAETLPSTQNLPEETRKQALDSRIDEVEDFVSVGRSKLKDIDALLSTGSN
ncbi:chemotaxis protein MotC [Rhizobium sp. LjRoot254]|uniref:chemotaxis protein MotC n=1 Tax=Rhizobium sp. LjRoot254 TaxID=3342297 RepID=UPI003ED07FB3